MPHTYSKTWLVAVTFGEFHCFISIEINTFIVQRKKFEIKIFTSHLLTFKIMLASDEI